MILLSGEVSEGWFQQNKVLGYCRIFYPQNISNEFFEGNQRRDRDNEKLFASSNLFEFSAQRNLGSSP
jgi:hypothetical protein